MFKPGREGRGMREEPRGPATQAAEHRNVPFRQDDDPNYDAELYEGEDDDLDYEAELCEDEDDEGPVESLLRHAPEIEAGLWPGWKLDRSQPGSLLWTTPSGRRYKSTLDGSSYAPYLD